MDYNIRFQGDSNHEYSGWRFDILKFTLSFFVVLLHSEVLHQGYRAILSVAVPVFFIVSSYLFWTKVDEDYEKIPHYVLRFIQRDLKLYLFWIAFFALPILFINRYFLSGIGFVKQLLLIMRDFFFWEVFPASWFLMALPLGMLIVATVVYRFQFVSSSLLCSVCFVPFITCWADEGGGMIINGFTACELTHLIVPHLGNSFVSSLFWISLGKWCFDHRYFLQGISSRHYLLLFVISCLLLCLEDYYGPSRYCFMLIPSSLMCFCMVLSYRENEQKDLRVFRRLSILVYVSHKVLMVLLNSCTRFCFNFEFSGFVKFFIVLSLSLLFSTALVYACEVKGMRWLRNAY